MVKVRVRGIYATALTKIFLESGHEIVQATDTILSRFNILHSTESPDVTVSDNRDLPGGLFIIGKCSAVETIISDILRVVKDAVVIRAPMPLYSVVMGIIVDKGQVEVAPGLIASLEKGEYFSPGDKIPVTLVNVVGQLRASPLIMPSTDYVRVIDSPTVKLSRHIKDPDVKMMLVRVGLNRLGQLGGLGIRWRSNAQYLSEDAAYKAIDEVVELMNRVRARIAEAKEYDILFEGECIASMILDAVARQILDDVRNSVVPTVKWHHSLKISMENTEIMDYTEYVVGALKMRDELSKVLVDYVMNGLQTVNIHHVKVDGTYINIGPAEKVNYSNGVLVVRRELKPGGVLDGLGVAKEQGDLAYSIIELGSEYITHIYTSSTGEFKGAYININTPVEPTADGVIYVDLEVDVVVDHGFSARVIDEDKLQLIPNARYVEEAKGALGRVKDNAVAMVKNYIDILNRLGLNVHHQGP